jgi:hypothetical protein
MISTEVSSLAAHNLGHGVSEQMRAVNFLNSMSGVSALSAVLSALRVIDNLSWTKATTQNLDQGDDADSARVRTKGRQQHWARAPRARHGWQQWIHRHLLHMRRDWSLQLGPH